MSELRREILDCIEMIPDDELEALKPLLSLLAGKGYVVETDLTDEEKIIIAQGDEEYKKGTYVPLDSI